MSYQPIENYGIIGNMRTIAVVGMHASIDWYCHPHFDSPRLWAAPSYCSEMSASHRSCPIAFPAGCPR